MAVDLLQEATNHSPADPTYHYHLGVAYQNSRDEARGKTQFERPLQLNPTQPQAVATRKALSQDRGG